MKLSTKSRYGVRLMLELAVNYQRGYVQLNEIAKNQNIPGKYSEQIISQLKSAGLVQSQRGAMGGYILSKNPSEINLENIVEILEGNLSLLDCLEDGLCEKNGMCPSQNVWRKLSIAMTETLENITLENMLDDYKILNNMLTFDI